MSQLYVLLFGFCMWAMAEIRMEYAEEKRILRFGLAFAFPVSFLVYDKE